MNVITLVFISCFVSIVLLGVFVYFRDPKTTLNRLYMLMCAGIAAYSFAEFGGVQSRSFEDACLGWNVNFIKPLILGVLLHFILTITEYKRRQKNNHVLAAVYCPAILFSTIELTLGRIKSAPAEKDWGWSYYQPNNDIIYGINYAWVLLALSIALFIAVRSYLLTNNRPRKNQLQSIAVGVSIGLIGSLIQVALKAVNLDIPLFFVPAITICSLFLGWATWQYNRYSLTPLTAAETIVSTMADSLLLIDKDRTIASTNTAAQKMLGYSDDELKGQPIDVVFGDNVPILPAFSKNQKEHSSVETISYLETEFWSRKKNTVPVSVAGSVVRDERDNTGGYLIIARDITERKKKDEELNRHKNNLVELVQARTIALTRSCEKLELETIERKKVEDAHVNLKRQLRQAQKMEAIGRLAGGVAHDFNNLLFVIRGNADSLLSVLPPSNALIQEAVEIKEAAERATELTQQLLAFSRKQVVAPKVIDLKKTVNETKRILARIIGEDIQFVFRSDLDSAFIKIDTGQVNQILTNLVINARDAMPDGGELIIGIEKVTFDETECKINPEAKQADYIVLSVADSGCGMDEKMLSNIFEPFYTTKGISKGTGLGLSTVYGIVKQNKGFLKVQSTPGKGSIFRIYFPVLREISHEVEQTAETTRPAEGNETILLVENESIVRSLAKRCLVKRGYKVIEARNAKEAIGLYNELKKDIDLLLTDVVMPGMSGKQLYEKLMSSQPDLRVLFMSSHADRLLSHQTFFDDNHSLIQKPFDDDEFSRLVRRTLDA